MKEKRQFLTLLKLGMNEDRNVRLAESEIACISSKSATVICKGLSANGLWSPLPALWMHLLIREDNGNKHLRHDMEFFIDYIHQVKCLQ